MLDGHVLVLNRSWLALHVMQVRRALCLLYQGHARALHPVDFSLHDFEGWLRLSREISEGRFVRTPNIRVRIPEVIVLRWFNGYVRHEVRLSRHGVFERDNNTCQYCGRKFPKQYLTLDHVRPQSRGGHDSWDNLVVACLECNVAKADRTPEEAHMPLARRPKQPTWVPQFGARIPTDQLEVWSKFIDTSSWKVFAFEN